MKYKSMGDWYREQGILPVPTIRAYATAIAMYGSREEWHEAVPDRMDRMKEASAIQLLYQDKWKEEK